MTALESIPGVRDRYSRKGQGRVWGKTRDSLWRDWGRPGARQSLSSSLACFLWKPQVGGTRKGAEVSRDQKEGPLAALRAWWAWRGPSCEAHLAEPPCCAELAAL